MKGYVITILSVSLIMILVTLSLSLRSAYLSTERALIAPLPLTYAGFLMDSVAYQLNSAIGPQIGINESNSSTIISINDTLASMNQSANITAYGAFLSSQVANTTASSITTNFTNISSGITRLYIDQNYVYTNNFTSNEMLFTAPGGTNATVYNVSFTTSGVRSAVAPMTFNASGNLNVTLSYTDSNGTGTETGIVSGNQTNQLIVTYANGSTITVTVGLKNGNSSSLDILANGINATISWNATLPPLSTSTEPGYAYDAIINYTQGQVSWIGRVGKQE
jgi:hypothetical protein